MDATAHVHKQRCLPVYLVIDVSTSMKPYEDSVNRTLDKLHGALATSPRVSEFAHMSIVAFSTQPWVVIEMTDMEYVDAMPRVMCDGNTNYGAAFDLVRERIDIELPILSGQGKAVLRPAVFFLTDGAPTDRDWEAAFARLADRSWRRRPHVITYGFGQAPVHVLGKVATEMAFIAERDANQDEALATAISSLLNSLVASAQADEMRVPTEAPGFRSVPIEYID